MRDEMLWRVCDGSRGSVLVMCGERLRVKGQGKRQNKKEGAAEGEG